MLISNKEEFLEISAKGEITKMSIENLGLSF